MKSRRKLLEDKGLRISREVNAWAREKIGLALDEHIVVTLQIEKIILRMVIPETGGVINILDMPMYRINADKAIASNKFIAHTFNQTFENFFFPA